MDPDCAALYKPVTIPIMAVLHAIVLGLIQGATEFLPVSSSGHLIFIPKLFGWADQGISFDIVVHLGTLCAVIYYYRTELFDLVLSVISPKADTHDDRRLAYLLLLSAIPAAAIGAFAGNYVETLFRAPLFIGINFILWGIVLWSADIYSRRFAHRQTKELTLRDSLIIGASQAVALIPGTSRSGITMTAGMFSGFGKRSAVELSFLMSVPIIALIGGNGILDLIQNGPNGIGIMSLIAGFIASLLGGLAAIWGLISAIKRWNFTPFIIYRIIVGVLILIFLV